VIVLAEGRLLNWAARPVIELRDVEQLHQPGDRPDRDLHAHRLLRAPGLHAAEHLDEEVARLHLTSWAFD